MNFKILIHFCPWEIDYMFQTFTQLKKSKYYLPKDVNITIETCLNLSDHIIDWDKSKLDKNFFKQKYSEYSSILISNESNFKHYGGGTIVEGNMLYGHLDFQKKVIDEETDYYITICPDIVFDERLLAYLIESTKLIKNEYFMITPQISKLWDNSWDILVNERYKNIPYENYQDIDIFDIIHNNTNNTEEIKIIQSPYPKFAGWFDLFNKKMYEELVPIREDWNGYGAWDLYSMIMMQAYKQSGGDVQQYILQNQVIFEYTSGPMKQGLTKTYKDYLVLKNKSHQPGIDKDKIPEYVRENLIKLENNKNKI